MISTFIIKLKNCNLTQVEKDLQECSWFKMSSSEEMLQIEGEDPPEEESDRYFICKNEPKRSIKKKCCSHCHSESEITYEIPCCTLEMVKYKGQTRIATLKLGCKNQLFDKTKLIAFLEDRC